MKTRRKRTNSNVPAKGRLREMADSLWSMAVRDDWAWKCAVCGAGKVEAHHIVPRQHFAVRYSLRNGIALCAHCHNYNADLSPHQNSAGWLKWLEEHHPTLHEAYMADPRPKFTDTKNAAFFIETIQELRQYVDDADFQRICGIKFSAWLEEQTG